MRAELLLPIGGVLGTDVPGGRSDLLMLIHFFLTVVFLAAIFVPCIVASQVDLDRREP